MLNSCGSGTNRSDELAAESADSTAVAPSAYKNSSEAKMLLQAKISPETYISSAAAVVNPNDSARKIIRTAGIKFKVDDVIKATYKIEDIAVGQGGLVAHTDLESEINDVRKTPISQDSDLVTTCYTVTNTLTLRVPSAKLDTTLKQIAPLITFMDYRVINAKNVSLDILAKNMEQSRLARYNARMSNAIDEKGKKLNDISDAEETLLEKAQQADEAQLANLLLADSIQYSTINLSLYQNQSFKHETVAAEKIYQTPFGTRFVNALKFGWMIITEIFLFLVNLWAIILLAAVVYFVIKYIRKKYFKK